MQASFLLFALAIGFRKISLFINIARWFISLKDFKAQMKPPVDIIEQVIQTEGNTEANDDFESQSKGSKMINLGLIILISLHGGLLLSLVFIEKKDEILFIVNFVHYYPMAIGIIICFLWIFWSLRGFVAH